MKNSANIAFVALVLLALGCACPRLNELTTKEQPSSTPVSSGPASSPIPGNKSSSESDRPGVTKANFGRLRDGMTRSEVERILGPGEEITTSKIAGSTYSTYRWEGDDEFSWIMISFTDDKVSTKTEYGLK